MIENGRIWAADITRDRHILKVRNVYRIYDGKSFGSKRFDTGPIDELTAECIVIDILKNQKEEQQ